MLDFFQRLLTHHFHRSIGQIADDGVNFPSNIAYFGEFSGLYLYERSVCQFRQAARDFCLANACGANHQNIFWRDFVTQFLIHLCPAPAVAQCNSHRAFGHILTNDVLVQFVNDFLGSYMGHSLT